MKFIYSKVFADYNTGNHPEGARRLSLFKNLEESVIESGEKYLGLVHSQKYIDRIKNFSGKMSNLDPDTIITNDTYKTACLAVGAAIKASEENAFALIRPPGHHAHNNAAAGFCIFNNIAIAVQRLVNKGERVFILDIDGHHGNGTQDIFYESDKVLYMSVHHLLQHTTKM